MIIITLEEADEGWTVDYRDERDGVVLFRHTSYSHNEIELRASIEGMVIHTIAERGRPVQTYDRTTGLLHVQGDQCAHGQGTFMRDGVVHHLGTGGVCLPIEHERSSGS